MFLRLILFAGLVVVGFDAHAHDSQGRAEPKGLGRLTCKQFFEEIEKNRDRLLPPAMSWLEGYVTAVNIYSPETYDVAPWQDPLFMLNQIAGACEKEPQARVVTLVHQITELLRKDRIQESQEKVTAEAGQYTIVMYKSILRDVQQKLVEKGFLQGGVDGTFGPQTRAAVEAFQEKYNIPVSGLPDGRTIAFLLYATPEDLERATSSPPAGQVQPQQ